MSESAYYSAARYIAALTYCMAKGQKKPQKPDAISWEDVLKVSAAHALSTVVFHSFDGVPPGISAEVYAEFERIATVNFAKHVNQLAAYSEVSSALTEASVPHVFLKGFALKSAWGNEQYRPMGDIDVYVSENYVYKAADALASAGYARGEDSYMHLELEKPPFIEIELHKHLLDEYDRPFDDFIRPSENSFEYKMSRHDELSYVVGHAKKHYENGGCGIKNVLDIKLYYEKHKDEIDTEQLYEALDGSDSREFYECVTKVCDSWIFGEELTGDLAEMEGYVFSGGAYGSFKNRRIMRTKSDGKLKFVFSNLFPTYSDMVKKFPILKKHKYLLPFCYVARFIKALFNGNGKKFISGFKK